MADQPIKQRRLRFSLLNLVLLTTIAALAVTIYRQQTKMKAMQRALDQVATLRAEAGALDIRDESKLYAIRKPEPGEFVWSYRVWLPEGRLYYAAYRVNSLPVGGVPPTGPKTFPTGNTIGSLSNNGGYSTLKPGEHVIRLALTKSVDGEWSAGFTVSPAGSPTTGSSTGAKISQLGAQQWPNQSKLVSTGGVFTQQEQTPRPGPFTLLDHRSFDSGSSGDSPDGAMVWIGVQ